MYLPPSESGHRKHPMGTLHCEGAKTITIVISVNLNPKDED